MVPTRVPIPVFLFPFMLDGTSLMSLLFLLYLILCVQYLNSFYSGRPKSGDCTKKKKNLSRCKLWAGKCRKDAPKFRGIQRSAKMTLLGKF